MIRKEVFLGPLVLQELRRILLDSEIIEEDDRLWPMPDKVGRQELELIMGTEHIRFSVSHSCPSFIAYKARLDLEIGKHDGCATEPGPRRTKGILLSGPRLEVFCIFSGHITFQGQAYLIYQFVKYSKHTTYIFVLGTLYSLL